MYFYNTFNDLFYDILSFIHYQQIKVVSLMVNSTRHDDMAISSSLPGVITKSKSRLAIQNYNWSTYL